jgi:phosphate transport system substrate-binding protein
MKRITIIICGLTSLVLLSCNSGKRKDTITISGAWALYPMAVKWVEEYKKVHPEIRIDVSAGGAGKGIADVLGGLVEIGMVSRPLNPEELKRGALPVAVAKDAVVAVVSDHNPAMVAIITNGLSAEKGADIWITGKYKTWGEIFHSTLSSPVHVYTRSDACGAAEMWAMFFGKKQEDISGIGVYGDPGLAQAVKSDSLGIGFNNIGYVYDNKTKRAVEGIKIVPLDLNSNGMIDPDESFYDTLEEIIEAISSGKYPSPPSRELYFVLKGKPSDNQTLTDFMKWILTDGQQFVRESGYVPLPADNILTGLRNLQ